MKISYQWLHDYLDLDILAPGWQEVGDALTNLGLALEGVEEGEDTVLDLDVTTNRPDWLNHLGVARELAVHYGLKLRPPAAGAPPLDAGGETHPASVLIEDAEGCPRYAARVITDFRLGPSPDWLRRRLEAVGQRSINNVVDVTNYVLLEMGHPLHAFDYDRLGDHRIVVRRARQGESLTTLDGQQRQLEPWMLLICDAREPAALAGIMGGAESEIGLDSRTLLLESAYFDPATIRRTATALGMRTEASYRFERGADPEAPVRALNRATQLILELAGGRCAGPVLDENPRPHRRARVSLDSGRLTRVVGVPLDAGFVTQTLEALEYEVEGSNGAWEVRVPGFRVDVSIPDDLAEDVLRHHGYNQIPSTYPPPAAPGEFLAWERHQRAVARVLVGAGFREAYNLVFTTPEQEGQFWGHPPELLPLANPLSEQDTHLRSSTLPGLLQSVQRNLRRGNPDVRLFEWGNVFAPAADPDSAPGEEAELGLAATGAYYDAYWSGSADAFSFHHLKGVIERVFEVLGLPLEWGPAGEAGWLHPGVAAGILLEGEAAGSMGQLHPRIQEQWKLAQPVLLARLSLSRLYGRPFPQPKFAELDRFPGIQRDLSFLVDKATRFDKIVAAVRALEIEDLRGVEPIDFYQGPGIPKDKVSLTVRLTFANSERTLTQEEVGRYSDEVVDALRSAVGSQPRS